MSTESVVMLEALDQLRISLNKNTIYLIFASP